MKLLFKVLFVVAALTIIASPARAQNLLTNGGLELVPPDQGGRYTAAPGWVTVEGPLVPYLPPGSTPGFTTYPGDYNNSGVTACLPTSCAAVDAADYVLWRKLLATGGSLHNEVATPGVVNQGDFNYWRQHFGDPGVLSMSEPSNFSHLIFEGDWQHWFQPYLGTEAEQEDNFAHLTQTVPGTPGVQYTMKGWALFENYFPGGVTNLNAESGGTPTGAPFDDGPLSPTDSFFGLDFLDSNGNVLAGSVEIELKAAGQLSNTVWQQHTLVGTAPAGTMQVRVRATMLDGVYNPLPSPQVFQMSFLVDDFTLTSAPGSGAGGSVPEPASWLLISAALALFGVSPRRSRHAAKGER